LEQKPSCKTPKVEVMLTFYVITIWSYCKLTGQQGSAYVRMC